LAGTPIPASNEANPDRIRFWILLIPCSLRPWTAALARCVRDAGGAMASATVSATAHAAANARISRDFTCSSSRDQCLRAGGIGHGGDTRALLGATAAASLPTASSFWSSAGGRAGHRPAPAGLACAQDATPSSCPGQYRHIGRRAVFRPRGPDWRVLPDRPGTATR
jgi:hypothetical protein